MYLIELTNGQVIRATTAQQPVYFADITSSPGTTTVYQPSLYGAWERGSVKSMVSFKPKSEDMTLTVMADNTKKLPAATTSPQLSLGVIESIKYGFFDAANVSVYTIYWPLGQPPSEGVKMGFITAYVGKISNAEQTGRSSAKFRVTDLLYLLNFATPPNIIQSGCRHTLFDHGCTLVQDNFKFSTSTSTLSAVNSVVLNLSAALSTASWWNSFMTVAQGKLKFTSGYNNGLNYSIKQQNSTTQITLATPLKFAVVSGDTLNIFPGCAKTITACNSQFNNLIHIGAFPFVPSPEFAI